MYSPGAHFVLDGPALDDALNADTGPVAKHVLKAVTQIETRAKQYSPVDTGRLRSSITSGLESGGNNIVGLVGTDVEYAPYVEFGTVMSPAQPFLLPAAYAIIGGSST